MFNSISWQEFLTAALWAHLGYYLIVIVVFYHKDVQAKVRRSNVVPGSSDAEKISSSHLMGNIRPDPQPVKRTVKSDDVQVSVAPSKDDYDAEQLENLASNKVLADLLNEIRLVARVAAEDKSSDGLSMIKELLSNYAAVPVHERQTINEFIVKEFQTQCSVELDVTQVSAAWPVEE